jgi:hypothetical protein
MADNKNIPTPRGTVSGFTAVQEPTWDYNRTAKEYQIKVSFDAADFDKLRNRLQKMLDAKYEEVLEDNPKLKKVLSKAEIGSVEYDDDGEETGRIEVRFKQKYEIEYRKNGEDKTFKKFVRLVDSRGKTIKDKVRIGTGSEVVVSFEPNPYYTAKDKEVGISFNRLAGVQLIKLVEYEGDGGPSNEDLGFGSYDDEDGFDASDYTGGEDYDDEDQDSGNNPADDETEEDF